MELRTTYHTIFSYEEYLKILENSSDSDYSVDDIIAHRVLKIDQLYETDLVIELVSHDKLVMDTIYISLKDDREKTRIYEYRGQKIILEPVYIGFMKYQCYNYHIVYSDIDWVSRQLGFTQPSYALKSAKNNIDEYCLNKEYLGNHVYDGYTFEIFVHYVKGYLNKFFYGFIINNWDGDKPSQGYKFNLAVDALSVCEERIEQHLANSMDDKEIHEIAELIVDYAVNKPIDNKEKVDYFKEDENDNPYQSVLDNDEYWSKKEDFDCVFDDD